MIETSAAGAQRTSMHTQDGLQLDAVLRCEPQALVLTYRVANTARRDVYLLNRLYRTTPTLALDANLIYVLLDPAQGLIHLQKKIADLPRDRYVNAPVAPFVSPVRAGERFSEQIHLPLPLHEYQQYAPAAAPDHGALRTYHQVRFSLGYYWSAPGTHETEKEIGGTKVVLPQLPAGSRVEWGLAETPAVALEVPAYDPHT